MATVPLTRLPEGDWLLEAAPSFIFAFAPDGTLLHLNREGETLTGFGRGEVLGGSWERLVHPTLKGRITDRLLRRLAEEPILRGYPFRVVARDGAIRDVAANFAWLRDPQGERVGVVAVGTDLTETRRLEEEARRQSAELALLNAIAESLAASPDLLPMLEGALTRLHEFLDLDASVVYHLEPGTDELRLLAGRGLSPAAARSVDRLALGEGFAGRVAATGEPLVVEDVTMDPRLARPVLREIGLRALLVVPLTIRGEVRGALGVAKREAGTLGPEEVRLLTAVAGPLAVAIQNARLLKEALRASRDVAHLLEVSREINSNLEVTAVLRRIVVRAVELVEAEQGLLGLLEEGVIQFRERWDGEAWRPVELTFGPGEGIAGWILETRRPYLSNTVAEDPRALQEVVQALGVRAVLAQPILSRAGEIVGILEVHNKRGGEPFASPDGQLMSLLANQAAIAIENARLFAGLTQQSADLEAKVRERTAALEEANRLLERASQQKSRFLAAMSHEFRTPLNSIIGFSEVLQDGLAGPLAPKQARYVENIRQSGRHLLQLVNDVVDLARVEAGRLDLLRETFALPPLLETVREMVEPLVQGKGLTLALEVPPDLLPLHADAARVKQVLVNLLSNAIKFTPAGGKITLTASQRPGGEPGGRAVLEVAVSDTGVGLSPEDQARIFQEFQQGEAGTRQQQGAGLGLALSKRLVELQGGRIWVESAGHGQGACFRFSLPAAERPGARRILVVEDERVFLRAVEDCLREAGFLVETAEDGEKALARLAVRVPDLLILDLSLPRLDGWELLRLLRAEPATTALPILVLTGLGVEHAERSVALGANEFLTKPVSGTVLLNTVRALLERAAPR
ncbi:MAG: GAF domain-containing protein [candidate division NC10 bacterium]|nr:GAF domain-containing protein [candidate division NC10 bacterium]